MGASTALSHSLYNTILFSSLVIPFFREYLESNYFSYHFGPIFSDLSSVIYRTILHCTVLYCNVMLCTVHDSAAIFYLLILIRQFSFFIIKFRHDYSAPMMSLRSSATYHYRILFFNNVCYNCFQLSHSVLQYCLLQSPPAS